MPSANTASTSPTCACPPSPKWRDCFAPADLQELAINKDLPVIAIRTPQGGRAFAQRARRHQAAVCLQGRSARLRRLQAHREQVSRGGAKVREKVARKRAQLRRTICWCWWWVRRSPEHPQTRIPPASAKLRPRKWRSTPRQDCCAWPWRRNIPTVTSFSRKATIAFCG